MQFERGHRTDPAIDIPLVAGGGAAQIRAELGTEILSLLRAALVICLIANFTFGLADILFEPVHDLRIGAVRWILVVVVIGLGIETYSARAVRRAILLSVFSLGIGCIQNAWPFAMHGDLVTPIMVNLALAASLSTAVPWGIGGQVAALIVIAITTIGAIAGATGDMTQALQAPPLAATIIICGASLYAAAVRRRNSVLSIERGLALRRSAAIIQARESQIRDNLLQLDTLYKTAPVGFSLIDRDLRFVRINDTLAEINGVPAQAHLGRTIREILPELADDLEPVYRGIFATRQPAPEMEVTGTTPLAPGVTRHWRARYWPIVDTHGEVAAISCVVREITEQRQAEEAIARLTADLERRVIERTAQWEAANSKLADEIKERRQVAEALRRSRQQLQDILDNTTAMIYLKDVDGRYVLINRQYEDVFHVDREQVVGRTDFDMFPSAAAELFRKNDLEVLTAGHQLTFEETVPHDDGDHTYVSLKFPMRDTYGAAYGICGISTDITPRKQMEAALQLSQSQLSALVHNTTDAIWSIDRDCRLAVVNPVAIRWFEEAYQRPLRIGESLETRAPALESAAWFPLYTRVLNGEHLVFEREYPMRGEMRSYLISMTPILSDEQVTGATVFAKDITDRKQAEEREREHRAELSHVLRLHTIGELAAGLAHEINQPLAAIANYARGCRNRIVGGDAPSTELLPVLEEIATQALRAGEIIRRLRSMVEKREATRENADINTVVREAVRVVDNQMRQHAVTLSLDLAPNLPAVSVDPIQIGQVVLNLVLNSLEAIKTSNGSPQRISVRTAPSGDAAIDILVEDTGDGLGANISERMFEPFFTTKTSGLGMGLTISRSIVEGHGGCIAALNNPQGGAQFRVTLPIAAA